MPPQLQVTSVVVICVIACLVVSSTAWTCLKSCTCTKHNESLVLTQVACVKANFTHVPRGLPATLVALDLSQNSLVSLEPGSLGQLPELLHLRLRYSNIASIADGTFRHFNLLFTLDLAGNRLQRLTEHSLSGLQNLDSLDLSDNKLDYVDGAFAGMRRLGRLDLRNNDLSTLTQFSLRDLENLQYLLLGGNRIVSVERDTFRNLERLSYLVLSGNPLGFVQRLDIASTSLTYVDMGDCGLDRLPKGLPPSIRYLQLRRNNITSLRKNSLIGYPNVGILILDNNAIVSIENKTFIHMTHLQQLWLNGNNLTTVPGSLPSSLQRLYLDNNQITLLKDVFPPNSQIDTLNLMNNDIQAVSSDALRRLPKLRSLDLSGNSISELRGHTFSKNTQLRRLLLSKNPLHTFHHHSLRGLRNLRTLSLAYVADDPTLPDELFSDLRQLRSLDFTSSPGLIQAFLDACVMALTASKSDVTLRLAKTLVFRQTPSMESMATLEELKLSGSKLTHIPRDFFDAFSALTTLQLSSTRFHCDDTMAWLRDWLRSTRVRIDDPIGIVCYSPRYLYLKPIASLADDDFALATPTAVAQSTKSVASATDDSDYEISGSQSGSGDGLLDNYEYDSNIENIKVVFSAEERASVEGEDDFDDRDNFANLAGDFFSTTTQGSLHTDTTSVSNDSTTKVPSAEHSSIHTLPVVHFVDEVDHETSSEGIDPNTELQPTLDITPQIKSDNMDLNGDHNDIEGERWGLEYHKGHKNDNKNHLHKHYEGDKKLQADRDVSNELHSTVNDSIVSSAERSPLSHAASAAIVTLTLIVTIGTAVVLIWLIVRLIRKRTKHADKYKHANGYYGNSNSASPTVAKLNRKSNGGGVTVAMATNGSTKNLTTTQSLLGESMTLIPGRDINHEGPLRVYTWEDF